MLQAIRDHAQGWIAWTIVGLIILTFALFGIEQYAQGEKKVVVAEVNGDEIPATEFLTLYQRQKQRLQQQFGEMYDQVVKDDELREKVLEAVIQSKAIMQYAEDKGLVISDAQLAAMIHSAPIFQKDDKFDQALYEEILKQNGLSVARFEMEQRQNLLEQQYRQLTLASTFATPIETAQITALETQQREVGYFLIPHQDFAKQESVSEEEIANYYNQHQADFVEPEKVSIDYLVLSKKEIAKTIQPTEEELKAYYEANKESFIQPEKRRASHILIRVDAKTPKAKEEAKKQAEKILAEIKAGKDFAELAKKYSQDPGSAKQGGDLGFFEQGMMVKPFDDAVFGMKKGEVKGPIETDFGYHIIKLTDIQPKKVLSYNEVKDQVKSQYIAEQADKKYYALLDKLNTIAYEQPDSLEPAAEVVGAKVKTSEPFSQKGGKDPMTSNPKVIQAAFSDTVKKSHENSSVIELSPDASLVLRINQVFPKKQLTLAEVREKVKKTLLNEKAKATAKQRAQAMLTKLKSGETPEAVASAEGFDWQFIGWVDRNSRALPEPLLLASFKAPKPKAKQPTWQSVPLANGDVAVLEVKAVKAGKALPEDQKKQLEKALSEVYGNAEVSARIAQLLAQAKVEKFQVYKTLK